MNLDELLIEQGFINIDYMSFYRDIFPVGSFERKGMYEDEKANGIIVEVTDEYIGEKQKVLRHTLTDELEKLDEVVKRDNFCIMSPISYIGKSRQSRNARFMYAMAIDLDGVTSSERFDFLMEQINHGDKMIGFIWGLPRPTYIVSSGTGLHLYYVFEQPIPLLKTVVKELEKLKRRLTWQAWTQGSSELHDSVQYESLFQGFRIVGTATKSGSRAKAYKTGERVTIEYLNKFVPEEYQSKDFAYKSKLSLEEAKKKYPEWYQKRIVEERPRETWTCKVDLYNWWIRKIHEGATQGHRYWCVMTLATYAKKCGVSYDKLFADSVSMLDFLNSKGDEFTLNDIMRALEAYNDNYITYPIDAIVTKTDIKIEKNKRNYRKQKQHLKIARFARDLNYEDPNGWINKSGRPTAQAKVIQWQREHPNGRKADCIRDTRLSKKTVYKWWQKY